VPSLWPASLSFWVSKEPPMPKVRPELTLVLYARDAMPRLLILAWRLCQSCALSDDPQGPMRTLAKDAGSSLYLAASSRPTLEPDFESQVALAPASTAGLTRW
jgi:hypothetical protein